MTTPDGGRLGTASTPSGSRTRGRRPRRFRAGEGPPGAPLPRGVRGQAILDGKRAAWSGQYDEWSFDPQAKIPYLERLRGERDAEIHNDRSRLRGVLAVAQRAFRAAWRHDRGSAHLAAAQRANAERWRQIARQREDITLTGLDILAGAHFPRLRIPWDDEDDFRPAEGAEPQADGAGQQADGAGPEPAGDGPEPAGGSGADIAGHDREPESAGSFWPGEAPAAAGTGLWTENPGTDPGIDSARHSQPALVPGTPARPRWLGPAGGNFAMLIPARLKYGILALLTLVEIPIYLKVFAYFNSRDLPLTWCFTLPVAVGMVLAPHLAGKLLRNRHMLPVEPSFPYLSAAVMVLWGLAGCFFGWLRQKVLLAPQIDPLTGRRAGIVDLIHVSPWTMTCVFTIILLLSGLIAYILGLAEAHPAVAAYRAAVVARESAEAAYLDAVHAEAEAAESEAGSEEDALAEPRRQATDRQAALWAEYQAAQAAYLDTVALEIGHPTVTHAVSAAIREERPPPPEQP